MGVTERWRGTRSAIRERELLLKHRDRLGRKISLDTAARSRYKVRNTQYRDI